MSDPGRPLESRLKGKFKALVNRFSDSRRPFNDNPSTGSRVPEATAEGTSLNVLPGAHNFVIKGSNLYSAQKIEIHHHGSSIQNDGFSIPQKPNSSALFTGRKDIIEKLKSHFAPQDEGDEERKSFLLYGMGGIGKTQICLKFAEEMADRFTHVFWIDASSEDTISLGLKGLCFHPDVKAGVSLSSVSCQSALAWICSLQTEWLLVFDNADGGPEVVEKYIPPGSKGNILVTSRNKSLGRVTTYENSLEVGQMSQDEAILLLLKAGDLTRASGKVHDVARDIVNELCCLPLAVDQAGAAIEAGLCSVDNYLQNLSQRRMELMNHRMFKGASQYNRTVYQTWELSFCEIEARARRKIGSKDGEAAQVAILILQTAAFFHHENILEAMFREASTSFDSTYYEKIDQKVEKSITELLQLGEDQSWNEIFFHEGIRVLRSFSLIKEGPFSGTYAIHPLMHKWNRDRMEISEMQVMHQVAKLILVHSIPLGGKTEDFAFRRLLFVHIKANYQFQQENHIEKEFDDLEYDRFSQVLQENGMLKDAEDLQYQVMMTRKERYGDIHRSTLISMADLTQTLSKQRKFEDAEELNMQVLNPLTQLWGPEHPDTLVNLNNLAITYSKQGKYEEAEKLNIQVLKLHRKLLGPEHLSTIASMNNLASTFSEQGKLEEAEKLHMQALNLRRKVQGQEHPDTLANMSNLVVTFSRQGKFEKAEKLNTEVLNLRIKLLGPEHPETLTSMNIASTFSKEEKFEEDEKLDMQILNLRTKLLGPEHPDTLASMKNLALTFSRGRKFEEAEKLKVQVLNLHTKLLGPEHSDTLSSMKSLAITFLNQGKLEEAEKLDMQVLNLHTKLLGLEHPYTLASMNNLALTFLRQEKFEEAERLKMQVLNLCRELLGPEHPDTLTRMNNLAIILSKQGKLEEAEKLHMQVLNTRGKRLGPEHPGTLSSMNNLAITFSKQGKLEESEKLHMQVLNLRIKLLGSEHPDTLISMRNLTSIFAKQGKSKEAEKLHLQLLNLHPQQHF